MDIGSSFLIIQSFNIGFRVARYVSLDEELLLDPMVGGLDVEVNPLGIVLVTTTRQLVAIDRTPHLGRASPTQFSLSRSLVSLNPILQHGQSLILHWWATTFCTLLSPAFLAAWSEIGRIGTEQAVTYCLRPREHRPQSGSCTRRPIFRLKR